MPAHALVARALAGAIVVQLTVAAVVLASGGAGVPVAAGLERARILPTVGLAERDVHTAAVARGPAELALAAPATTTSTSVAPTPTPTTTTSTPTPPPATSTPPAAAPTTAPPPPPTTAAPAPAPAPAPQPPPPSSTRTTSAGSWRDAECEVAMLGWMNEARSRAGRSALHDDPVVDHVAFEWADRLAASGQLAHNPSYADQLFAARPEAMTAGEVVGRGMEPRGIFDEFLRSSTHRDAILRPAFTRATVGCVRDGAGQAWVVANFWG